MKLLQTLVLCLLGLSLNAQFEKLVVVEIDNKGLVPGSTYQFYAQFLNENDHVHIIFGEENYDMYISSTERFYQNDLGGPLSTNINAKIDSLDKTVKYDSYFTIGRTNSKDNFVSNFNMELDKFETKGSGIKTDNGAWYVTPDQMQAYCKEGNKHILIMQLTSTGTITGKINLQGKDNKDLVWREMSLNFSSDDAISEKEFKKLQKNNLKNFKKLGK